MRIRHLISIATAAVVAAGCGGSSGGGGGGGSSGTLGQGATCTPSTPTAFPDPACSVPLICASATSQCDFAVCPAGVNSTFAGVKTIFASCVRCHTPTPAAGTPCIGGPCGGLDLSTDPYAALVGVAGNNFAGTVHPIQRVAPGDSANSLLFRKLTTTTTTGAYGRGMPFPAPGSVCPAAVTAVQAWIDAGALNN